jgi:hypothetical protein
MGDRIATPCRCHGDRSNPGSANSRSITVGKTPSMFDMILDTNIEFKKHRWVFAATTARTDACLDGLTCATRVEAYHGDGDVA